jgi:hypothetical protein
MNFLLSSVFDFSIIDWIIVAALLLFFIIQLLFYFLLYKKPYSYRSKKGKATVSENDLIQLNVTTDELFRDPRHSDFTVTHELIVNKIGDPRWW